MNMLYDFSSALLQARQRKGVTQEQIAFSLDISQATYNAWECGHRLCPYKHIVKTTAELKTYYMKLIAVLADECTEWLKTLEK